MLATMEKAPPKHHRSRPRLSVPEKSGGAHPPFDRFFDELFELVAFRLFIEELLQVFARAEAISRSGDDQYPDPFFLDGAVRGDLSSPGVGSDSWHSSSEIG